MSKTKRRLYKEMCQIFLVYSLADDKLEFFML